MRETAARIVPSYYDCGGQRGWKFDILDGCLSRLLSQQRNLTEELSLFQSKNVLPRRRVGKVD